jgi:hypothetical protein
MKRKVRVLWIILCIASLLSFAGPSGVSAEETFITIGGGDPSGVYFTVGLTIAKIVNQKRSVYGIRASVEATTGSAFNLDAIMAGYLQFGLIQSDRQYQAVHGLAVWKTKGPQQGLRAVFSLHPEAMTLVAATDAGINTLVDLKGKRVSTGNPGSSQHQMVQDTLMTAGLDIDQDIIPLKVMASDAPALLQDKLIDAFFFTVGHPSETIRKALASERKARIISISGPGIDRLVGEKTQYIHAVIPVNQIYPEAAEHSQVQTLSVLATLCTSAKVPTEVVYALTREVFENFEAFRRQHSALNRLTKEGMLKGLSAPLHPGARQYFKESGLIH